MRIVKYLLLFLFIYGLVLPASAQDIIRLEMPKYAETFTVKLKSNSLYAIDPFPYDFGSTPEAMIISGICASNWTDDAPHNNILRSHTVIRTITSGCIVKLTPNKLGKKTDVFTLVRARKATQFKVTHEWQKVKLGKGTYTLMINPSVMARIDMDRSSKGCRTAHNGLKDSNHKGIASFSKTQDGEEISILAGAMTWYRILSKSCTMWLRAHEGKTGTLTLLKLSSKAIKPPKL